MKRNILFSLIALAVIMISITYACKKEDKEDPAGFPTLTTVEVSSITTTSAVCGGNVTSDGGAAVTARGVCWSKTEYPTIANGFSTDGSGTGVFTSNITTLLPNTFYYMRAYATNSTGTSYGNQVIFSTFPVLPPCNCGSTATDLEGNVYKIVQIGSQCWFAENLKVTKYNDGSNIPYVSDSAAWHNLNNPAYCWFENNEGKHKATYGALYNWKAVNGSNGKNPCPSGWHLPTKADWDVLTGYLGGPEIAGGKMKEVGFVHWGEPNSGATNESGFTALPGSSRANLGGFGLSIGHEGYWWSKSIHPYDTSYAIAVHMRYSDISGGGNISFPINSGFSCRCVKD